MPKKRVRRNEGGRGLSAPVRSVLRKAHKLSKSGDRVGARRLQRLVQSGSLPNPRRVKGAKVAGGRAVSLRNFTGRVIRKRDGTVQILGRMQKTK